MDIVRLQNFPDGIRDYRTGDVQGRVLGVGVLGHNPWHGIQQLQRGDQECDGQEKAFVK